MNISDNYASQRGFNHHDYWGFFQKRFLILSTKCDLFANLSLQRLKI